MSTRLDVRFGGHSVAGKKPVNQDAFAAHLPPEGIERDLKGAVAVICDGVSSARESQVASQMAVTGFITDYYATPPTWSVHKAAGTVLRGLNQWVYRHNAARRHEADSMLTTLSAVVIKSHTLHVFHAGDSRVWLLRGTMLECLTRDHVMREGGRDFLARALGADSHLEVDHGTRELREGDRIVLTTDGVHGFVSNSRLLELLSAGTDLEATARSVVDEALAQGSDDNVSALVLTVDQLPLETLEETHRRLTERPIPPVLAPGHRIDGYEVLAVIFSGTRSHMYRVKDVATGTHYVLKAPSEHFAEDTLYLDGFIREEWVGQRIDHPNVMKTFAGPSEKRFMYYLGEAIDGMNLREWMHDHPRPPLEAVRTIVRQIIAGLRAFQRADMVHQDLKPENVMIDRDERVKIIDFGTVRIAATDEIASPLDTSIPQGSVNYVAPEYLMGEPGSFRADLFSLGVITYEMITGELPFAEPRVPRVTLHSYNELKYRPARHCRRDLPVWVEGCLRKALQPNPAQRYDAFSEFETDFTVPNPARVADIQRQPLLEKHPLGFWRLAAIVLLILNLVQLALWH